MQPEARSDFVPSGKAYVADDITVYYDKIGLYAPD